MLTIGILGEDFVRDLGGVAHTDGVDGTDPDDVLLLWFDSILDSEVELFDGPVVDSEPLELRTGLGHLHVVAGDWGAAILGRRLPCDIDMLSAGVGAGHFQGRRWSAWKQRTRSEFTSERFLNKKTNPYGRVSYWSHPRW